jgi:hypothetical protein
MPLSLFNFQKGAGKAFRKGSLQVPVRQGRNHFLKRLPLILNFQKYCDRQDCPTLHLGKSIYIQDIVVEVFQYHLGLPIPAYPYPTLPRRYHSIKFSKMLWQQ